jgi:hypothetical protein
LTVNEGAPEQPAAEPIPAMPQIPPIGEGPAHLAPPEKIPFHRTLRQWLRDYFLGDDPTVGIAYVPLGFLAIALFTRSPRTNFIFDEQEALLANPYVRSIADPHPKFRWIDAFYRDFWGLGPERSIGSYRPIPDLVWRALWGIGMRDSPFFHHWVNVYLHALNGALLCLLAFKLTKNRTSAWFAGISFTACALLTEAVSGVVGIADVLGATGAVLAMLALTVRLPFLFPAVFGATLFGLYSKESALCCVPLVPLTALLCSQMLHPEKPRRWARAAVSFAACAAAFVLYVEARRRMFPAAIPAELSVEALANKPPLQKAFGAVLRWYAQPSLPRDPLNNPLVNASGPLRVSGALRVYFRGLLQLVWPHPLSGDYSAPQEPVPDHVLNVESLLGAILMILPFVLAVWLGIAAYVRWVRERSETASTMVGGPYRDGPVPPPTPRVDVRPVVAIGGLWIVLSYFPVSNIPVLLPTVRAERFWYFPAIGSALILGVAFGWLFEQVRDNPKKRRVAIALTLAFFGFQAVAARLHANDYTDDLVFWDATRKAVPRSAKAHLNYSVMKGARGDLEARRASNEEALKLAPQWPMASIYLGDTLCRLHRAPEAWPHYKKGFELAPNDVNLVALALQCLWDEKQLEPDSPIRAELDKMKDTMPGSWVDYLARDILEHGEEHNGVDPKYRPRGYNEGPKD